MEERKDRLLKPVALQRKKILGETFCLPNDIVVAMHGSICVLVFESSVIPSRREITSKRFEDFFTGKGILERAEGVIRPDGKFQKMFFLERILL